MENNNFIEINKDKILENTNKNKSDITQNIDYNDDFNQYLTFNVNLYKELFLELRKRLDYCFSKKDKSDKDYEEYDEMVFNITTSALNDCGAQDFVGYCYKKGFYDFCVSNYEKYMKWTILAAANGNAFSLSKLQIFLTTAIDDILEMDNHDYLIDFLDLSNDNYILFLSKLICVEMVKIMDISPEKLIKLPEKFQEQNEETQKIFDRIKIEATNICKQKIKYCIDGLYEEVQSELNKEHLTNVNKNDKAEVVQNLIQSNPIEDNNKNINKDNLNIKNNKDNKKKKFRY